MLKLVMHWHLRVLWGGFVGFKGGANRNRAFGVSCMDGPGIMAERILRVTFGVTRGLGPLRPGVAVGVQTHSLNSDRFAPAVSGETKVGQSWRFENASSSPLDFLGTSI
jgi:hypothetical protein